MSHAHFIANSSKQISIKNKVQNFRRWLDPSLTFCEEQNIKLCPQHVLGSNKSEHL